MREVGRMDLNINSPAYYTQKFGVEDEIYWFCRELACFVKEKNYSDVITTIGFVPIIAPREELEKGLWKETKKCEPKYRVASVSLQIDYEKYVDANMDEKKALIMKNVVDSVKAIKTKGKIDFNLFKEDMMRFCKVNGINFI